MNIETPNIRIMLKAVGIVMVIYGGLQIIHTCTYLGTLGPGISLSDGLSGGNGAAFFTILLNSIIYVVVVITGCIGIKFCNDPRKAPVFISLSIIILVLTFVKAGMPFLMLNAGAQGEQLRLIINGIVQITFSGIQTVFLGIEIGRAHV